MKAAAGLLPLALSPVLCASRRSALGCSFSLVFSELSTFWGRILLVFFPAFFLQMSEIVPIFVAVNN